MSGAQRSRSALRSIQPAREDPVRRIAFSRVTSLIGIRGESLFALVGPRIEVCNLQGTVKNTLTFTDAEGSPITLDIMGNFLVVATSLGHIKMWDVSRRQPKMVGGGTVKRKWEEGGEKLAELELFVKNASGKNTTPGSAVVVLER